VRIDRDASMAHDTCMPIQYDTPAAAAGPQKDNGERSWSDALLRGFRQRCPACGQGALYSRYLKVADTCGTCGTELHHHQADDAPPYFTIFIVGHFILGGALSVEQSFAPPMWVHLAIWLPLTLIACLWLLPRAKGALIGIQWAHRMHGFAGSDPEPADDFGTRPSP
jgi:uncharacterized protein (DUF983 family)